jgi:TPR repeat protein
LGRAHIYGHGVIRDREAGCRMLRSSAEQGSSREAIEAYNKHCAR